MAFFKVTHYTKHLLEATAESGCVVEGLKVLCAKLLIKCGRNKVSTNLWIISINKCLERPRQYKSFQNITLKYYLTYKNVPSLF
jgi:hypothetical protein